LRLFFDAVIGAQKAVFYEKEDFKRMKREKKSAFLKGIAIDPTCINIRRLERTETNLMHFKWELNARNPT